MKYLSITQRLSFVVVLLFHVLLLQAADVKREITVTEAGTLSTLISASEKMQITDLKVSGSINGADIKYICEMAGFADDALNKNARLYSLDLKDANIVEGGLEGTEWVSEKDALGGFDDNDIPYAGFRGCYSLREMVFPSSLTLLKFKALEYCQNLSNVVISSSKIRCEYGVFELCNIDALRFLSSGKMEIMGTDGGIVADDTNLNKVTIEAEDLEIRGGIVRNNNTLKSVSIKASGNATFLDRIFVQCTSLSSLSINVGGRLVDGYYDPSFDKVGAAFGGCTSLETFEMKATSAFLFGTFSACANLKSFRMDVSNLDLFYTFEFCSSLSSIDFSSIEYVRLGSNAFQNCTNLQSVKANSDAGIGNCAFRNCTSLKSVKGFSGNIESYAFDGCTSLDSLMVVNGYFNEKCLAGSFLKAIIVDRGAEFIRDAFAGSKTLPAIVNNGSVSFRQNAFADFSTPPTIINNGNVLLDGCFLGMNIPEYTFDKGKWIISNSNFDGCGLKNVQVGLDSSLYLDSDAFSGCKDLETLDIKCREVSIYQDAFSNSGLKSLSVDCDDVDIRDNAFKATSLTNLSISNRNEIKIGKEAFADCQNLTCDLHLNGDVEVEEQAFKGFKGFKGTTDLSSLAIDSHKSVSIESDAFADWDQLHSVKISGAKISLGTDKYGVKGSPVFKNAPLSSLSIDCDDITLKDNVFEGHSDLAELSFKAKYASLGESVFKDCPRLSSLKFDCDTMISFNGAFIDNMNLTDITINSHKIYFGNDSFKGCRNLKSLIFTADGEDDYVNIFRNAFSDCSGLTTLVLPSSVSYIGESAFFGCTSLTSVKVAWPTPLLMMSYNPWSQQILEWDAFEGSSRETCVLYVPRGTKEAYLADRVWGKFGTIVEYDVTGIDKVTTTKDAKEISRYSTNGQRLTAPAKGLNIVKYSDGSVRKVLVK